MQSNFRSASLDSLSRVLRAAVAARGLGATCKGAVASCLQLYGMNDFAIQIWEVVHSMEATRGTSLLRRRYQSGNGDGERARSIHGVLSHSQRVNAGLHMLVARLQVKDAQHFYWHRERHHRSTTRPD